MTLCRSRRRQVVEMHCCRLFCWAHNPKVGGSNPPPATNAIIELRGIWIFDCGPKWSCKLRKVRIKAVHETVFFIWCDLEAAGRCTTEVLALRFAFMKAPP